MYDACLRRLKTLVQLNFYALCRLQSIFAPKRFNKELHAIAFDTRLDFQAKKKIAATLNKVSRGVYRRMRLHAALK